MKNVSNAVKNFLRPLTGLGLVALLFASCKKNDSDYTPNPVAGVMAFNLAADKNAVAFTLSGNYLGSNTLAYTNYTGAYLPVYTGTRDVKAIDYNISNILATTTGNFADSSYYSVFLTGFNGNYRNVLVKDELESLTAASGKAWVRYINAVPDSSIAPVVTITANGDNVVSTSSPYASVSSFVQVNAGAVNTAISNGTTVSANRTITLEENKVYTVLFVGLPSPTDASTAVQVKFIQNATVTP
jgi:hypothetical protein